VTSGAFQTALPDGGYSTGFVTRLNPTGTALLYSTYLGGSNGGGISALASDSSGNAYVAGTTESYDFPTTTGAFQVKERATPGINTGFVSKLNSAVLRFSTPPT